MARSTRVFIDRPLSAGGRLLLDGPQSKYLLQVLRLRRADAFVLFDGQGRDVPAEIAEIEAGRVLARLGEPGELEAEPAVAIHLGLGISKGERMDFAIQKAVELGVSAITPLWTSRSVVRLTGPRLARRQAHWQGVLIAACEQSGRRRLASLHHTMELAAWLAQQRDGGLLLDHRATRTLPELPAPSGAAIALLIGTEGGLAPAEKEAAGAAGFTGVRLGPRVMRTETAPLAAIAAIQTLWGDFR